MSRAYEFLMRPTVRQAQALSEMLRDHCGLYNGALRERRDAYHRHVSKTTVRYGQQSVQLKDIRAVGPERQGRWSFSSQQATLRRWDKGFVAFFRRVKSGATPGCPRSRGVNWFDTVDFPKDGDGCRRDSTPHDLVTRVRFQGVGHVKVNQHRPVAGRVKTVSVKREGRKRFVVLTAEQGQPEPLPKTGSVVGIDLGIASFLTDSDGVPNGGAAKAGLNRAIADAGRGAAVDPRNTSRRCPECGHTAKENRPTQEKFRCLSCGHTAHADVVGARNVLRAGLVRRKAQPA
ncbi:RNA-guided endonuclease InsQ/TnpB family protein [Streptomyces sp. NBC_00859]|uniref:RNA-guided endonuclease InsQ/TnpB family protein n=1 Tax=Streptomyces sp. NBC_00859 TaxID=2903682 RepID=UPI0038654D88|nr:zinc ribbon domain-containing protein [Streptomyces sp. NBC_00859]